MFTDTSPLQSWKALCPIDVTPSGIVTDVNTWLSWWNALGPIEVLSSRLEKYDDAEIIKFATELYNLLSKDKSEDAKELMDEFYKEKYPIEEEVEED